MELDHGDVVELELKLDPDVAPEFRVDRSARRIAGLIMPYGVVATDARGMGRWRFQRGSLNWKDVSRVKLLRDHDISQPVGRAVSFSDREDGLHGVFQVARGPAGDEVLMLAEDGILDGFSAGPLIEPDGWEPDPRDRGVRLVSNGRLVETTVTAIPAFDDARVYHVAAMFRSSESSSEGSGSMAEKDDNGKSGEGDGATVLTDPDAAMAKFEENLDQRFGAMTDRIGEVQKTQTESVTRIITEAFDASFKSLEGAQAGRRAEVAAARIRLGREEPVYRFDGSSREAPSMVKDFWRANTERDSDSVERLRKFQAQQRDMVDMLVKIPPTARAAFAGASTTNAATNEVINEGYRPDLFVNELIQGRPIVAQASRGTITDATPFRVPRFVSMSGMTADHTEGVNPGNGTMTLDSVTVDPGAVSGRFELTREIVDAANPAIDAIALAAMRESYNQQTEVKAYAALNGAATGNGVIQPPGADDVLVGNLRTLLARYPFTRFASPSGGIVNQATTVALATATDTTNRPLLPSVGAQNASGLGNAVSQGWYVDGLPFVPAWAMTNAASNDVAIVVNRSDWWVWESPLLTFRFEEKQGPALIELALFAYFAVHVLRPSGIFALRNAA